MPAAGVVAEAMVALVLADAALEKFGGDSVGETRRNYEAYLADIAERGLRVRVTPVSADRSCWSGPRGRVSRPSARCSPTGWAVPFVDVDAVIEERVGKPIGGDLRRRR